MITAILAAAALSFGGAAADDKEKMIADLTAGCKAFQAEHGGTTDCKCLAKKTAEDKDLLEAMNKLATPEDVANAPDIVKKAIMACTPAE